MRENNPLSIFNFKFWKAFLKKLKVILIVGEGKESALGTIKEVLKLSKEEILAFSIEENQYKLGERLIKSSSLPILVITHFGEIPYNKNFFAGEKEKTIWVRRLAKNIPSYGYLVLNFDDETVREIKDETNLQELTFGFERGADFYVTDIKLNSGTNFKLNFENKVLPIWLKNLFGKEYIYSSSCACAIGRILNLNMIEVVQSLSSYQGISGKLRLTPGIKNSKILEDTSSQGVFSFLEALNILREIPNYKRKIAVLGDMLRIERRVVEIYKAIGERVKNCSDLLFTFGQRAKFIAEGARESGMAIEKIFQFDTIKKEGIKKLEEEIREGDLVLVKGERKLGMGMIIEKLKKNK